MLSLSKPAALKHIKYLTFKKNNVLIGEAELSKLKVDLDEVEFFL